MVKILSLGILEFRYSCRTLAGPWLWWIESRRFVPRTAGCSWPPLLRCAPAQPSWQAANGQLTQATRSRSPSSALLPVFWEGSPTKINYREKGTLILTSLLEDLGVHGPQRNVEGCHQNRQKNVQVQAIQQVEACLELCRHAFAQLSTRLFPDTCVAFCPKPSGANMPSRHGKGRPLETVASTRLGESHRLTREDSPNWRSSLPTRHSLLSSINLPGMPWDS